MTETRKPGLGNAPKASDTRAVEKWMQRVNEILQVMVGTKGDKSKLDKVVTFRDLSAAGIAVAGAGGGAGSGTGTGGTGSGTELPPYSVPPAPTGLVVTEGFSSLFLEWDVTSYPYLSHTEIWQAEVDNLGVSAKAQDAVGNLAAVHVGPSSNMQYFWVRYISQRGDPGPFNAVAGTPGQTALDPAVLLDVLTDSITSSQLAESLRTPIQQIPLLEAASAQTIANLNQEILDRIAAIQVEALARETDDDALASQISTVFSNLTASIDALDTDLQGQITANAGSLTTAIARLNNIDGNGLTLEALAAEVETLVVSGGSGEALAQAAYNLAVAVQQRINAVDGGTQTVENLASLVSSLNSTIINPTTGLSATRTEALDARSRLDDLGGGKSAETVASDVVGLAATINDGSTGLAAAHQRSTTVESRLSDVGETGRTLEVLGINFDSLSSAFNDPLTGYSALSAAVSQVQTDVSGQGDQITVLTSNYNSLASSLADVVGDVQANATAISNTNLAVSNIGGELTAQGDQITQLIAEVDGNSAAIQTEASVRASETGELFGRIGMKIDVNGRIIGWALNNDGQQGDFIVAADRFAVGAPGMQSLAFVVDTNANRVVMPGAYIQDATITDAKIQSVSVDKITGNLATFIQGNFNVLQSTNFSSALQRGWRLNVNGSHEIYGGPGSLIVADKIQANAIEIIDTKSLKPNAVSIWEVIIQDAPVNIPRNSDPSVETTVLNAVVDFTEAYPDTPVQIIGQLSIPWLNPTARQIRFNLYRNNLIIWGSDLGHNVMVASSPSQWATEFVFGTAGQAFDEMSLFLDFPGSGIHTYSFRVAFSQPSGVDQYAQTGTGWLKFQAGKR